MDRSSSWRSINLSIVATRLYSVDEAIERLKNMLGDIPDWQELIGFCQMV